MRPTHAVIKKKFDEIFTVAPNDLGIDFLTMTYKRVTHPLKTMPFIFIIPICFFAAILFYVIFDHLLVRLVTLLQYGF